MQKHFVAGFRTRTGKLTSRRHQGDNAPHMAMQAQANGEAADNPKPPKPDVAGRQRHRKVSTHVAWAVLRDIEDVGIILAVKK